MKTLLITFIVIVMAVGIFSGVKSDFKLCDTSAVCK
jgi:uncharacterized membrane protein